jgi:hypothetical protein
MSKPKPEWLTLWDTQGFMRRVQVSHIITYYPVSDQLVSRPETVVLMITGSFRTDKTLEQLDYLIAGHEE